MTKTYPIPGLAGWAIRLFGVKKRLIFATSNILTTNGSFWLDCVIRERPSSPQRRHWMLIWKFPLSRQSGGGRFERIDSIVSGIELLSLSKLVCVNLSDEMVYYHPVERNSYPCFRFWWGNFRDSMMLLKMCLYRDTGSRANLRNPYPVFFLLSDTPGWINHPDVILLVN